MSKKVEVIIIEDDTQVVHRTVSTVYEDSNAFNVAIQAIVEALTGTKPTSKVQQGAVPLNKPVKDKFAEAVPNYIPPAQSATISAEPVLLHNERPVEFHPDLVNAGIAPKVVKTVEGGIPTVKLDMKSIMKGAK